MSRDLTQQLAEYGRQHDDALEAVTLTEVIGERTPRRAPIARHVAPVANGREIMMVDTATTPERSKRARQLWMLGGAAAAVVALTVGGLVVLRADGDDPDDVLATSVTTATTATTAAGRPTVDEPPPTTSASPSASPDATQSPVAPQRAAPLPVLPQDALGEAGDGVARPTVETPLPDFDAMEIADSGDAPRMLTSVDDLPASARLDFLWEPGPCDEDGCFRDAHFRAADGSDLGAPWVAGEPFHIRHGFVNDSGSPLGQGFDLAVYAYSMPFEGGTREAPDSTRRYTADSVVLGETDACGPTYESQTGTVTCEWYVHDFPDGLPEGRWALWAVWEAPCLAWIDLGRTESCTDPDEVMSFFSSGVDSPFVGRSVGGSDEPTVTEVGDWTRVDGADVFEVVSDGNVFFGTDGGSLLRSDDGITWEEHTEFGEPNLPVESLFDFHGANFDSGPPAAIRDGRLVAVEDLRGTSVIVQIVDSDGTQSTQVVPVEIPVAYEPFHRELNPGVHLLDDGSIVITASYSADAGLVEATGRSRAELGLDLFYP
ncbi:MAG: hypothetical protein ACN4IE_20645, partial [Ilumatobacter sp.]